MRKQFDRELQTLENQFLEMGQDVLESASKTMIALAAKDYVLAQNVIDQDKVINNYQITIEMACARLLALQQPQVSDLRFVITVMTACSDLERMGDHMAGVARSILKLKEDNVLPEIEEEIHTLGKTVLEMHHDMLHIFSENDAEKAKNLAKEDQIIDEAYLQLSKTILTQMKIQETSIRNGTEYISILKHIERYSDYISNICERLVYLETGEITELN
ncbi:phosphate transport system regulatory protein PhoU [Streptococcus urinalis FB127-CNA-2]|uniref:Phosphate-specific transport system accessory protein PhoU n=1 Tax=Streptococcus urinalis 2285-97 TaxID=764291 RepID=G5KHW4_9STRE|nr:phosphate signaling complex protein PhoU [Streptococcus urinalis]EHJ56126.1 phosphate transport system regulatory protein PhoU [Streptococcus urinalis 2285-97]EKS22632.1 phosphate transport system regulatory protein PhoU [Streptococcus urinalis FB127-CNA-2]VEF32401.1 phosphate transport system protein [Streptococcus urinalis]